MLDALPLIAILAGLALHGVLAGADFGAGIWVLISGGDGAASRLREHARHAMGPVWEANHVWLIFVLVVSWTAYPVAFASIASTLSVPLFIAAIGIILRGTAYALRAGAETQGEGDALERLLGLSSLLTPFALGTVVGGIASGRVPIGNAKGDLLSSWLNPTSCVIGALAVAACAFLAAVYLAADARRLGQPQFVQAFRLRALVADCLAGALALAALAVVHADARPIWHGLTHGWGALALAASAAAGLASLALVWRERFESARVAAAISVVAVIAGWGVAQRSPLPGLSLTAAAAGRSTILALLLAIAVGAVVLVPSLALLFSLVLRGRFDQHADVEVAPPVSPSPVRSSVASRRLALFAVACLLVGVVFTDLLDPGWARVIGVLALLGFLRSAFVLIAVPDD